jgi:MFS family permease
VNSYLLINIVALGPGGKLADHWGYRNTLRLGQAVFGAGCLLPIAVHHFAALVAGRVLMALGGAMMVPTVMAVFKITVPAERRHRVFGYFSGMMGFAAALGPSLGGLLVDRFGWVAIFLMNLPPLAFSVFFSTGFFRATLRERPAPGFRLDWVGTLLFGAALVCLVTGLKGVPVLLALAVAFAATFVWHQRRSPRPLIDLRLFRKRAFAAGCAIVGLQNLAMYALLFQLPYLLGLLYQWGPEQAGHYMTAFMISMMAASILGGRVAERAGPRRTCMAGSLIAATGFAWLSMLAPGHDALHLIGGLVLGGTGLGLANGPSQSAAMATVDLELSGIASGVLSTCRYLGGVIGISVLAWLLSSPDSARSLARHHQAILIFVAAVVIAAVASRWLPAHARHD